MRTRADVMDAASCLYFGSHTMSAAQAVGKENRGRGRDALFHVKGKSQKRCFIFFIITV